MSWWHRYDRPAEICQRKICVFLSKARAKKGEACTEICTYCGHYRKVIDCETPFTPKHALWKVFSMCLIVVKVKLFYFANNVLGLQIKPLCAIVESQILLVCVLYLITFWHFRIVWYLLWILCLECKNFLKL